MHHLLKTFFLLTILLWSTTSQALLSLELTQGVLSGLPIAIATFSPKNPDLSSSDLAQEISTIIHDDLANSGRFKVTQLNANELNYTTVTQKSWSYFEKLGVDNLVLGEVESLGNQQYQTSFKLLDVFATAERNKSVIPGAGIPVVINKKLTAPSIHSRQIAHHISDLIYEKIFRIKGVFSTRLAYIVIKNKPHKNSNGKLRNYKYYTLEIADADGANPRTILSSSDPLMSPAWSRDGKQLAYVSFEKKQAAIYIQNLTTGKRQLVSRFPGINGAPAWSPDGKKLAIVLSMSINPNIYVLDLATKKLSKITNDGYLNTEPAWSPDGQYLFFTSTRSGGPQIYQYNFSNNSSKKITNSGNYNARSSLTADGRRIVVIHKDSDSFSIAIFDLDTGAMRILTPPGTHDSSSPSVSPNGSMVLYDTVFQGKNMLAMVSTDGRIQLRLPDRDGEAQDPAWSPFLS